MNPNPNNTTLPDELGERISAYLDGELSQREAAEVERLLASDPTARLYADELRGLSQLCHTAPAPTFTRDLSSSVMAEALRRQALGEASNNDEELSEPESYYGLPLGKGSRGWVWGILAAAAAVMIGFYGRPEAPQSRAQIAQQNAAVNSQQLASYLNAMQQASPGMQVVNYQATPQQLQQLRQRLAFQPAQRTQLPGALMAVSEPADNAEAEDQLVYVEGEQAELDRLLGELKNGEDGSLVTVAPNHPAANQSAKPKPAPQVAVQPTPTLRAVPLRVKLTPEQIAQLQQRQQQVVPGAPQRRFVVLRIQFKTAP
jgi:anti-sigma factor RsiW